MNTFKINVGGHEVEVCKPTPMPLLVPMLFMEQDAHIEEFIQMGESYLRKCSDNCLATPWLLASGAFDIFGAARSDSPEHSQGLAFDMSPMYSEQEALSPDRSVMGLAWNIKSLVALSQGQDGSFNVWAEGDHLHFRLKGSPMEPGDLGIAWSESAWYPVKAYDDGDPIMKSLFPSLWWWKGSLLSLLNPVQARPMIARYLADHGEQPIADDDTTSASSVAEASNSPEDEEVGADNSDLSDGDIISDEIQS